MRILLILLLLVTQIAAGFEYSDEETKSMEEGLRQWTELAANPEVIPAGERLEKLALGLRKTTRKDIYVFGDREGTHEQLRNALLSQTGYADHFANRLRSVREDAKGEPGSINRLEEAQLACFQTLAMLPSTDSVRVLGEFLYDEEERVPPSPSGGDDDRNTRQRELGVNFNASYALGAMAKLPLVAPPVPKRKRDFVIYDEDIEAWRLWYEQVKSGKRTFRFEGDPKEYSLAGPVSEAWDPKGTTPAETTPAEVTKVVAESSVGAEKKAAGLSIWPLAFAGGLFAVAIWFATKRKSAAA